MREALRRDIDNNPPERPRGQRPPWEGIDDVAEKLSVPTLVVGGDADDIVHPQYPLQYYLSLPEEIRHLHVFHGVGHYLNAQAPEKLAGVFVRFLRDAVS